MKTTETDEGKKRKAGTPPKASENAGTKINKKYKKHTKVKMDTEDSDEERDRTPSGTSLAGAVKDLRYFFSSANTSQSAKSLHVPLTVDSQEMHGTVTNGNSKREREEVIHEGRLKGQRGDQNNNNNTQLSCLCRGACSCGKNKVSIGDQRVMSDEEERYITPSSMLSGDELDERQETIFIHQLAGMLRTVSDSEVDKMMELRRKKPINKQPTIDTTSYKQDLDNITDSNMVTSRESNDDSNPEIMSVPAVIAMLQSMKAELQRNRQEDLIQLRELIKEDMKQFQHREKKEIFTCIKESRELKEMNSELNYWKIRSETLTEVCNRMYTEITDLTTRIESLELSNSKKMVILTGLKLVQEIKKKETLLFLNDFINTNLGTNVNVDDFFTLGAQEPRPIVLIFQTVEDKRRVMQTKSNLRHIQSEQPLFINEYYPPTAQEKKRRDQDIVDLIKHDPSKSVSYIKGSIAVNGEVYKKLVEPPSPKELIEMSPQELNRILQIKTIKSKELTKSNSKFMAYVAPVQTHEDVKDIYKKIKLVKPDARHVVCAYWLKDVQSIQNAKDYHDDGEAGAGRILLELLEAKDFQDTAIFVMRKYGGVRMGADRFMMYAKVAKEVLGIEQDFKVQRKRRYKTEITRDSSMNQNARGRGRGGRGHFHNRGRGGNVRQQARHPTLQGNNQRFPPHQYHQQQQRPQQLQQQQFPRLRSPDLSQQPRYANPTYAPTGFQPNGAQTGYLSVNQQQHYIPQHQTYPAQTLMLPQNFPPLPHNAFMNQQSGQQHVQQGSQVAVQQQVPLQQPQLGATTAQMSSPSANSTHPQIPHTNSSSRDHTSTHPQMTRSAPDDEPNDEEKMDFTFSKPHSACGETESDEEHNESWDSGDRGAWSQTQKKDVD